MFLSPLIRSSNSEALQCEEKLLRILHKGRLENQIIEKEKIVVRSVLGNKLGFHLKYFENVLGI